MTTTPGGTSDPRASAASRVTALRAEVAQLRAQVEAADTPAAKTEAIVRWTAARAQVTAALAAASPSDLFSGLPADVPLALLPARLETRFADGADVLHVRIFPDDLHVYGHDPELTQAEADLGAALWAAPNDLPADGEPAAPPAAGSAAPADPDSAGGRRARWAAMVTVLGGPRAAWVAHATRPAAGGGSGTAPVIKAQAYIRPAVARVLPDRWLVRAYTGGTVAGQAWTSPVGVDLHLTPDPQAAPPTAPPAAAAPALGDPQLQWLTDYQAAVAAGMAVDVPLPAATRSLDRVVAVGVRASTAPADAAAELAGLLTGHRYTDGLGFLPPGSPTSNTPDTRSGRDRHADPDLLWRQEFGPAAVPGTAATRLSAALGLPPGTVDGTDHADEAGDAAAAAMQAAIWSATWGYYLGQLLDPAALRGIPVADIRAHYLQFVRGRGTLPTLRVGRQPYGVLPLLPLASWTVDGAAPAVDGLARLLIRVRPLWQFGVGQPVTASGGSAFDQAFTRVMSSDAVGRSYRLRSAIADRTLDPLIFTGITTTHGNDVIDAMVGQVLSLGGNPLILNLFSPQSEPVRAPLVADPTDPAPDATIAAAILGLVRTNPVQTLVSPVLLTPKAGGPATVLHTLLRRSLLLDYAAAGLGLSDPGRLKATTVLHPVVPAALPTGPALPMDPTGPAGPAGPGPGSTAPARASIPGTGSLLFGLTPASGTGFAPVTSLPTVISAPVTAVTGSMATGEWLWRNPNQFAALRQDLDATLTAFSLLATLPAADLELLLRETLDLATHRWTAWAESLAAEKLTRMRATTTITAGGLVLGGWGVVERLTRRTRVSVDPGAAFGASTGPLWADDQPGGFVHAPSTAQAATAAVLRAAHLAHGGEADPACAVDLSSAPARDALRLVDGLRAGQDLAELLGYELERYLHDRSADILIARLRAFAPRGQAGGTFVESDAADGPGSAGPVVSPSAIVDGLAIAQADPAAVARAVLPAGTAASSALAVALAGGIDLVQRHQDALADLLTAESVHQVLAGNSARAGAALDAAARGGMPPDDYEVLRTPRSGAALTCRVAVVLPAAGQALPGGWPVSPRGSADPSCAAWLAAVLPPLARVRVRTADAAGAVTDVPIPAAALLGPLDIVLDLPEAVHARIQLALPAGQTVQAGRDPAWTPSTVGLDELLTVAADLREVLRCRPLRSADLSTPASTPASSAVPEERDAADLTGRLARARASLQHASATVLAATGPLTAAVAAAAGQAAPAGLPAAVAAARTAIGTAMAHGVLLRPDPDARPAGLLAVLAAAAAELTRRLAIPVPGAAAGVDDLVAALQDVLGAGQPAVPRLVIDAATAAVAVPGLAAGDRFLATAPDLAADWLDDSAAVRTNTGLLVNALQGCDALSAGAGLPGGWRIIDPSAMTSGSTSGGAPGPLPGWTATLAAAELAGIAPAETLVVHAAGPFSPASGRTLAGLLVDTWVEVVPQPEAATSVAYQADAPTARAPQAILLGLAPDIAKGWNADLVADLALEALSLARLRTVDAETAAWLGRMLPAVLLPDGDAADVIGAPPRPLLQVDPDLLAAARLSSKELG